jgi:hypothetical protein
VICLTNCAVNRNCKKWFRNFMQKFTDKKKQKDETCCKVMMNECWDLGITTFVSHITRYITYCNFSKNSYSSTCKTWDPTAAVRLTFHIEYWVTSIVDWLIMAYTWNVVKYQHQSPYLYQLHYIQQSHIHRGSDQAWSQLLWLVSQDSRTKQVRKFTCCDSGWHLRFV